MTLLSNSIIEGIREDCAECKFRGGNLEREIVSCRPLDQSVSYRASINNWDSVEYPVTTILDTIRGRYRVSDMVTLIMPTTNFSSDSFAKGKDLELTVTDVETTCALIGSGQMSGDGEIIATTGFDVKTEPGTKDDPKAPVTKMDAYGADTRPQAFSASTLACLAATVLALHSFSQH